nr:alpha/beta hydrolase-fold protein [Nocardiopsis mwathae]
MILVSSSLVVALAGTLAAFRVTESHTGELPPAAAPATAADTDAQSIGPALNSRPGEVAVCTEPGEDEILTVPDPGAPDDGRPIWVRRPPGPDSADLPVLYLLHGSTGTHRSIMEADAGPLLDEEMCRSGVEFVIAAPFGQEIGGADTEWGDAVDGSFQIETFVTQKAIEAVEGDHRRPRSLRAIGGFSMGGYGAAAIPLRHPELYSQAISWAGYFRVDDPSGTFGDDPATVAADHAPDRLLDDPDVHDIRFMLIEGTDDRTPLQEGSIHGEARRFERLLEERDMTVRTSFPEGDHDFDTWTGTFPEAVDFLVEQWAAPDRT